MKSIFTNVRLEHQASMESKQRKLKASSIPEEKELQKMLNTGTFTAPNRSQRTHELEIMPHQKQKTRETKARKMAYNAHFRKKKRL